MAYRVAVTFVVFLCGLVCLSGCPKGGSSPEIRPASLSGGDREAFELLKAAGDRATLTLMLRPNGWPAAVQTLRPYLAGLPVPPGMLDKVLAAPNLLAAFAEFAAAMGEGGNFPRELAGWDQGRPVVAALFEPGQAPASLAKQATGQSAGPELPGMRHRVLIPASDSKAMLMAFMNFMGSMGVNPDKRATGFAGLKGGVLYPFPDWKGFVALVPEARWLRIELVTHQVLARAPNPGEEVQATLLASWSSLLDKDPAAANLPFTPALHFATTSDEILLAYVRPWMFREVSSMMGTRNVLEAVTYASPEMRAMLMAVGFAEVNIGTVLLTPLGAEMDDLALGLSADGVFRFRGVASLTELGARMYQAGAQKANSPFTRTDIPAVMQGSFRLDLNELLKNARSPGFFSSAKSLRELAEPLQECGFFCPLHIMLRNPAGMLKTLRAFARFDTVEHLPRSAEFALIEFNPMNPAGPVKAALAVSMPLEYNPRWLKETLGQLEAGFPGGGLKTQMVIKPMQDYQAILIGLNLHPEEVFGIREKGAAPEALTDFQLDLARLTDSLPAGNPMAVQMLKQISTVRGSTRLSGRALVGQVQFGAVPTGTANGAEKPKTSEAAWGKRFADYSGFKWASPGLSAAESKGAGCLNELVKLQIMAFRAVAGAAPTHKALLLDRAMDEVNDQLVCALNDPATKSAASDVHLMMVYLLDYMHENLFAREQHLAVLAKACSKGLAFACQREKELKAKPEFKIIEVAQRCGDSLVLGPGRMEIRASGQNQPEVALPEYPGPMGLLVEKGVAWSRVAAALGELKGNKVKGLEVLVRDSGKNAASLPARQPGPADELLGKFEDMGTWVWVKLDGIKIELGYSAKKEIAPKEESLDLEKFREELTELDKTLEPAWYYLDASPQTPFENLAAVLAVLTCDSDGYVNRNKTVVLGPAPPAPTLQSLTQPAVMGALDKNIIQKVIRRKIGMIKYCYEKQLVKNPSLKGMIEVQFTVSSKGAVVAAKASKTTIKNREVTSCVLKAVRQMKFPKPKGGGIVIVKYPFVFKSAG